MTVLLGRSDLLEADTFLEAIRAGLETSDADNPPQRARTNLPSRGNRDGAGARADRRQAGVHGEGRCEVTQLLGQSDLLHLLEPYACLAAIRGFPPQRIRTDLPAQVPRPRWCAAWSMAGRCAR